MEVTHRYRLLSRWRSRLPAPSLLFFALFIALPFTTLFGYLLLHEGDSWQHLADYLLLGSTTDTLLLIVLVVLLSSCLGMGAAIAIAFFEFPARQLLRFWLIVPLAIPPYIFAFSLEHLHDLVTLPFANSPLINTALVLSATLFPYLYLLCLLHFENQSGALLAAARLLGNTPVQAFMRVVLPAARPALVAGLSIIVMETIAEFGAPSLLGLQTITVVIMRVWSGMGDFTTAVQLAGYVFVVVIVVFFAEQYSHNRTRAHCNAHATETTTRHTPQQAWLLTLWCMLIVCLTVGAPVGILCSLAIDYLRYAELSELYNVLDAFFSSMRLALISVFWLVISALVVGYGTRGGCMGQHTYWLRFITMGYAMPGVIIAMGLFIPFTRADLLLADAWLALFGEDMPFMLTSGFIMLTYAYMVRFFASAFHPIQNRLMQVSVSMDEAAATFGVKKQLRFKRIHMPLIRDGIFVAGVFVFIEVLKELPEMTLILRPFNMTTLAVQVYEFATDEQLMQAALPSLVILLLSCYSVFVLYRVRYAQS